MRFYNLKTRSHVDVSDRSILLSEKLERFKNLVSEYGEAVSNEARNSPRSTPEQRTQILKRLSRSTEV